MQLIDRHFVRVLIAAQATVRTQTSRSTKPSRSFLWPLKGFRGEKDAEELSALEVQISASLKRFQVSVVLYLPERCPLISFPDRIQRTARNYHPECC
jgi:hypothetical protein